MKNLTLSKLNHRFEQWRIETKDVYFWKFDYWSALKTAQPLFIQTAIIFWNKTLKLQNPTNIILPAFTSFGLFLCVGRWLSSNLADTFFRISNHSENLSGIWKLGRITHDTSHLQKKRDRIHTVILDYFNPSSIYSCSISHILEHEICHLGCWAVKEKFLNDGISA